MTTKGGVSGGGVLCGWCAAAKKCMAGDTRSPTGWKCNGAWAWNSCDAADMNDAAADARCAAAHANCRTCNGASGCSWCLSARPSPRCQAGSCRNWAPRTCQHETRSYLARVEHPGSAAAATRAATDSRIAKERAAAVALAKEDQRLARFVKLAAAIAICLMTLSLWSLCRMCRQGRKTGVDTSSQYDRDGDDWVHAEESSSALGNSSYHGAVIPSVAGRYGTQEIYTDA